MKLKKMYRFALIAASAVAWSAAAPLYVSELDDQIETSFKNTYVYKTYLKNDSIKVKSENGSVTLSGTVSEESHKALANDTAENLPGVTLVDNQLATKAEAAAESADTWIGRKVKLALLFHRNVNDSKTAIEVKDGVVTLKGEASSKAQKELTAEYAKDIEGVKEVKNEMTVASVPVMEERTAGEKTDDASVTAQVKTALSTHRSTRSLDPQVTTRDGTVTLTGIVHHTAEKALVSKLVGDIHGVTDVENKMTVEEPKTK